MSEKEAEENERLREERAEALTEAVREYLNAKAELASAEVEIQSARTDLCNAFCDYQNMRASAGAGKPDTVVVTVTTGKLAGKTFLLIDKGTSNFDVFPIEIVK